MDNLIKISGGTAYGEMAKSFSKSFDEIDGKVPGPKVIVDLLRKAILAKKPKTRYSGGYMAGPILFMRKILPDRAFDKMLMGQLK